MEIIPVLIAIVVVIWEFMKTWWWVPLPVILFFLLKNLYLWYKQNVFWAKITWINLELKVPKDVERPIKAMEAVVTNFWSLYDPADFKEKWWEGKFLLPFFLEIAGIDGNVHFFLRIPTSMRHNFESAIYSQYPEVEVAEVEDYTKNIPQDIPNQEWDLWGADFAPTKKEHADCYPLRTYEFFEPTQEVAEEKRIDPLAVLVEGMSRLKKGEQLWLQLRLTPTSGGEHPWQKECKDYLNELLKRPKAPKDKSITESAIDVVAFGMMPYQKEKEEKEMYPPEMRLSPGERDVVQAIEGKLSKAGFISNIRMIYLGKKDVFFKPHLRIILNFSVALSTSNLNGLKPVRTTKVVPPYPFRERALYMKKKRMIRRYFKRQTTLYPWEGGTNILNAEEIATVFHFPSKVGAPTPSFTRIESKRGGPPPSLPIEE